MGCKDSKAKNYPFSPQIPRQTNSSNILKKTLSYNKDKEKKGPLRKIFARAREEVVQFQKKGMH
jgi:hypothetical protein